MVKKLFTLGMLVCGLNAMNAQEIKRCATYDIFRENAAKYPGYIDAVNNAFNLAKSHVTSRRNNSYKIEPDTIYRIPVVVHIIYNTPEQNIHDSLVYNQIEVLNQDYRRQNPDTSETRNIFKPVAADAGIEFFLAPIDPNGDSTTGITRTPTDVTAFSSIGGGGMDGMKSDTSGGKDAWDTEHYLNIWVCNLVDNPLAVVLGFAYPPEEAPNWPDSSEASHPGFDGVAIHYEVFGRNNPRAVGQVFSFANKGRTATHEIGHYLGLRHLWGDGPLSLFGFPDCSVDDGIEDTPNSGTNSQLEGCDVNKNTCTDSAGTEYPDMFENYMDYSREECQNIFTHGQVAIMRAMLETARKELPYYDQPATGLEKTYANDIGFKIYPNPSNGIFEVQFEGREQEIKELILVGILGNEIKRIPIDNVNGKILVDLQGFISGVYFLRVSNGIASTTKKLIIN